MYTRTFTVLSNYCKKTSFKYDLSRLKVQLSIRQEANL
jgi:hypothetical protein